MSSAAGRPSPAGLGGPPPRPAAAATCASCSLANTLVDLVKSDRWPLLRAFLASCRQANHTLCKGAKEEPGVKAVCVNLVTLLSCSGQTGATWHARHGGTPLAKQNAHGRACLRMEFVSKNWTMHLVGGLGLCLGLAVRQRRSAPRRNRTLPLLRVLQYQRCFNVRQLRLA